MDSGVRGRATLWLRAERARGVDAVPLQACELVEDTAPVQPVVVSRPVTTPRAQVAPVRVATSGDQGNDVRKTSKIDPTGVLLTSGVPFTSAVLSTDRKIHELRQLDANSVKGCTRCPLCQTRTNTVFGEGDAEAKIFFVGEGPGENEDLTGRPFVGRAGQLLDKMIVGMGLTREQVYIGNIVKCRPPDNRVPQPEEAGTCMPYLDRQIELVRPQVIVTLGLSSAKYLLGDPKLAMGKIRGQWTQWRGIKLMPTFHPSYVLRVYTPEVRGMVWGDLQQVMEAIGLRKRANT